MEENQNDNTLQFMYPETIEQTKSIIKVVGVGGGGSNAVQNMYKEGIQEVTYLVVNTDKKALEASNVPNRLQISDDGLGAGALPEKAEAYAIQYEEAIRASLNDGTKMAFITAGMGGGTGTGAGPVVAKIAKELGILTIGIVTIPFEFEGVRKIQKALRGVAEMRKHVDALLVVNNTRLAEIYPDLNFFNAFKKADDTLTVAAKSISDIINITGYINLDFEDVKRTLEDSGVALISTGEASGENRLSMAIKNAITSPLLQDNEITKAERLLFEVCFSTKSPMTMAESLELNEFVAGLDPNIDVIWGALVDDSLDEQIRIIVLAAGYEMDGAGRIGEKQKSATVFTKPVAPTRPQPVEQPKPVEQPAASEPVVEQPAEPEDVAPSQPETPAETEPGPAPIEEAPAPQPEQPKLIEPEYVAPTEPEPVATTPATQPAPIQQPEPEPQPVVATPKEVKVEPAVPEQPAVAAEPASPEEIEIKPTQDPMEGFKEICQYYGKEKAFAMQLEQIRKNYYMLDDEDLTNEQLVEKLEHMPSYNRSFEQLCELKSTKKQTPDSLQSNNHGGEIF